MIINKYRANSLKAAIDKARSELGLNARVIHVRQLDKYSAPGTKSSNPNAEKIEIIMASDEENSESSEHPETNDEDATREAQRPVLSDQDEGITHRKRIQGQNTGQNRAEKRAASTYEEVFLRNLDEQLPEEGVAKNPSKVEPPYARSAKNTPPAQVESQWDKPSQDLNTTGHPQQHPVAETRQRPVGNAANKDKILHTLQKCCSKNQVNADITYELLSLLDDERNRMGTDSRLTGRGAENMTARDYMSHFITKQINISGSLDMARRTSILIGPTGVGKTTTLAKLAAQCRFQQKKTVGLITIDAYRIAAIDQLKTYSQIMSIPLKVALTPEELERCISDYDNMDLILVDTPGRSQFDTKALGTLQDFLEAAQPADTHLLIAVSTRESDTYAVVENFAPQYVRQLIFTKLDETASFGPILNIGQKIGKPISFLTTGQNVPDDIEAAQIERMADLFLSSNNSKLYSGG